MSLEIQPFKQCISVSSATLLLWHLAQKLGIYGQYAMQLIIMPNMIQISLTKVKKKSNISSTVWGVG